MVWSMQRKADTSMLMRLRFVAAVLGVLCFGAVVVRLFHVQVLSYERFQQLAVDQQTRDKTIYSTRGTIYDTNMKSLAISKPTHMVTLEAQKVDSDEQGLLIAEALSRILELDYDTVLKKVQQRASYAEIKRGVEDEQANEIRAFIKEHKLDSIYLIADSTRAYPYGNFLAHVLGFVGVDEQGLYGLEKQYDDILTGTPGRIVTAVNARGDKMPTEYEIQYDPIDGNSLVLAIDEVLQHYLEKELQVAFVDNKAKRATGIVMDVNTGGILAMANYPDFNPNDAFKLNDEELAAEINAISDAAERKKALSDALNMQWRNNAISDQYYAGSTFKIITAAIALEEKAVSLNSRYYCSSIKRVENWDIKCWRHPRSHGDLTLAQAIQQSCNPAFIEIGQAIGWENMVKYHSAFGLDKKTGIDLPGEAAGSWFSGAGNRIVDLAVGSFGQNFPITPIELITAVSAVANGGTLLKPHLVKEIIDSSGNIVQSFGRTEVRQVLSSQTSEIMNDLLESVVTVGTGKNAYTAGYRVAGKTGTTEKIGIGDREARISSFVAFAPADNPQIAVLILLDEPTVPPVTGGITVAPVIRRFMEQAMPYLNVEAVYTEAEQTAKDVTVPDITGLTKAEAEKALAAAGLSFRTDGGGETVTAQLPAAGAVVSNTAKVIMYMGTDAPSNEINMPDLYGMSLEKAKSTLANVGLFVRVTGATNTSDGNISVTKQSVPKDSAISYGAVVTIELSDLALSALT